MRYEMEFVCEKYEHERLESLFTSAMRGGFIDRDEIEKCEICGYTLTVIDRMPDNSVINKILELPKSRYDRPYKADNLYHDVITLY